MSKPRITLFTLIIHVLIFNITCLPIEVHSRIKSVVDYINCGAYKKECDCGLEGKIG